MVFKRRDKLGIWKTVGAFLWPKGGWWRAALYVKYRLRRLPDPPHRIARGIFAGIFVTFTPFFTLHFVLAALVALIIRGNVIAALLSTFFGNPITFVPIAAMSLKLGHWMLGSELSPGIEVDRSLGGKFLDAGGDLYHNSLALFSGEVADWSRLSVFYYDVFLPYLVGGLIPGLIAGVIAYYVTLPLIQAYQNRRKGMIKSKLQALKEKAKHKADAKQNSD